MQVNKINHNYNCPKPAFKATFRHITIINDMIASAEKHGLSHTLADTLLELSRNYSGVILNLNQHGVLTNSRTKDSIMLYLSGKIGTREALVNTIKTLTRIANPDDKLSRRFFING